MQALLEAVAISVLAKEKGLDLVAIQDNQLLLEYRPDRIPSAQEISGILDRAKAPFEFLSGKGLGVRISIPHAEGGKRLTFIKKTLQNL